MQRILRARIIHREVMLFCNAYPHFQYVNSGLAAIVDREYWHARIHTIDNLAPGQWWPRLVAVPTKPGSCISRCKLPNRMGLWLAQGPKVLTVEWMNDRFDLIHMRRGSWEHELFGLPAYCGQAALEEYELFRRRSRRW